MAGVFISAAQAQERQVVTALFCDKPEQLETLVYIRNKTKASVEEALAQVNELAKQEGTGGAACGALTALAIVGAPVGNPVHDAQLDVDFQITEVLVLAVKMGPGAMQLPEPTKQYIGVPVEKGHGA